MSEERFELTLNSNGQADIIDKVESKEKNALCIYNDLGVIPFTSAKAVCNKLNEQEKQIKKLEKRIKELEKENKQLQIDIMGQSEEIEILSDENKRLKQGKYVYGIRGGSND